jgi:hypothetical protein
MASVRAMITRSGSARASSAALILASQSAAGITALPAMWPQRFGNTWSSMNSPATPAFSYSRTARATLVTLPKPVSASASSGSGLASQKREYISDNSVSESCDESGRPSSVAVAP